jgi:hypothetical protein
VLISVLSYRDLDKAKQIMIKGTIKSLHHANNSGLLIKNISYELNIKMKLDVTLNIQ